MKYVVYGIRYKNGEQIRFTSPQCAETPEEAIETFKRRVYDEKEFRVDGARPKL